MSDTLEVWLDDPELSPEPRLVGTLARSQSRSHEAVRFRYSAEWLADRRCAFAIDPALPLTPGDFHPSAGRALHGVFRDSAPDRWGRVLMERREADEARRAARRPRRLSDWDFLTGVSDVARMGALRLRDPHGERWVDDRAPSIPPAARLRELEAAALALDAEDAAAQPGYADWLRLLVVPGSSLGGARPKASYTDQAGALWLAKFPANEDRRDVGAWEFLAHEIARIAGVEMPAARIERFGSRHHTYCVKRFDRTDPGRRMYASAMTLLQRDDGEPASYLEIAEALQREGDVAWLEADLHQLYRRIAFSILIGNRDDHLRNHGFLRGATGWRLAPAFDVNPNPDKTEHALAIDELDPRPDLATLRSTAPFYRLDESAAAEIETEVRNAVRTWRQVAASIGLVTSEVDALAAVLEPGAH
ncbi:MAG: type II toxin-antitoxin system HipA family toxin [Planctomycetes bacterium]|nr:type II toxin-antitoxin system HipA family toxin [Planctomycetota bacterium]